MSTEQKPTGSNTWTNESLDIATRRVLLAKDIARLKDRKATRSGGNESAHASYADVSTRNGGSSPAATTRDT